MPTYEYACSNCGHTWEEIQKISEDAIKVCPSCHKETAQRQISGGTFILKGGGWYADLYSSSKANKKAPAEGSTESKTDTKAETKTDTKAETKTEAKTETKSVPPAKPTAPSSGSSGKSD